MDKVLTKGLEYFKARHIDVKIQKHSYKVVLYDIFDKYWDRFAVKPASRSRKYHHPVENLQPFGLVNHGIRVQYFNELLLLEEGIDRVEWDKYFFADYTHDFGKLFMNSKADYYNHGLLGAEALKEDLARLGPDGVEIYLLIKNHMHHWNNMTPMGIPDRLIAYADFLATQTAINIDLEYLGAELFQFTESGNEEEPGAVFKKWS